MLIVLKCLNKFLFFCYFYVKICFKTIRIEFIIWKQHSACIQYHFSIIIQLKYCRKKNLLSCIKNILEITPRLIGTLHAYKYSCVCALFCRTYFCYYSPTMIYLIACVSEVLRPLEVSDRDSFRAVWWYYNIIMIEVTGGTVINEATVWSKTTYISKYVTIRTSVLSRCSL